MTHLHPRYAEINAKHEAKRALREAHATEFEVFMARVPMGPGHLVRIVNFERLTARMVRTWKGHTLVERITPCQGREGWWVSFTLNAQLGGTYEVQYLELLEPCENDQVYADHFGWAYDSIEAASEGTCARKWPDLVRAIHTHDPHRETPS